MPSLAAIILAVGLVQTWTIRELLADTERGQAELLEDRLATLQELLRPYGTVWRREGDRLLLGDTVLNDRTEIVDAIARLGGAATIFAGDQRVATSVPRPDGGRATGTRLAAGAAYDTAVPRS